jgi:hypothetical protein
VAPAAEVEPVVADPRHEILTWRYPPGHISRNLPLYINRHLPADTVPYGTPWPSAARPAERKEIERRRKRKRQSKKERLRERAKANGGR